MNDRNVNETTCGCGCGCGPEKDEATTGSGRPLADATVNEVIAAWPATVAVFARHGVDACCGGGKPVAIVAERHGLRLEALLAELGEAAGR